MVDADDAQRRTITLHRYRQRRPIKGAVFVVNWHWVVGIIWIAADITRHAEPSTRLGQRFGRDEGRDTLGQVDAVDEDIRLRNLCERASVRRLCHVPLEQVRGRYAYCEAEIHGSRATAAQRANDNDAWMLLFLLVNGCGGSVLGERRCHGGTHGGDEGGFVVEAGERWQGGAAWVKLLVRPGEKRDGGASVASIIAEGGEAAA